MNKLDYTFNREHVFVGTTGEGARVFVSGRLYRQPVSRDQETVDHGTVNNPEGLGRGVVAFTGRKNISRNLADGIHDESFIAQVIRPAPGFTLAEVQELSKIIARWHNNTLKPGCTHIDTKGKSQDELLAHGVCPVSGYKYGSQWLAEPLPDDVRSRFIELMEKGETQEVDY